LNHKSENGESIYIIDGPDPFQLGEAAPFAVTKMQIAAYQQRESCVAIAQLANIVRTGLITAKHIFRGLKRPLLYEDDKDGDIQKLVFTWAPPWDYDWELDKRFDPNGMTKRKPPAGLVYAVSTTPNNKPAFPSVKFWIDRWYWIDEDPTDAGHPIDWKNRYEAKLK